MQSRATRQKQQIRVKRIARPRASREKKTLAEQRSLAGLPHLRKAVLWEADLNGKGTEKLPPVPAQQPAENSAKPLENAPEKTLTVKEAAFRLGKSPDAVYNWLRSGRLRGRQPGGRCCSILVLESSVTEALLCPLCTP